MIDKDDITGYLVDHCRHGNSFGIDDSDGNRWDITFNKDSVYCYRYDDDELDGEPEEVIFDLVIKKR